MMYRSKFNYPDAKQALKVQAPANKPSVCHSLKMVGYVAVQGSIAWLYSHCIQHSFHKVIMAGGPRCLCEQHQETVQFKFRAGNSRQTYRRWQFSTLATKDGCSILLHQSLRRMTEWFALQQHSRTVESGEDYIYYFWHALKLSLSLYPWGSIFMIQCRRQCCVFVSWANYVTTQCAMCILEVASQSCMNTRIKSDRLPQAMIDVSIRSILLPFSSLSGSRRKSRLLISSLKRLCNI